MKLNVKTLLIGVVCSLAFVVLMSFYYDYVIDDAFIGYRYSKHLAQGHGIVWNIGEDPVEGYTNFLWVVLNAAAIFCKVNPVVFSKILSSVAALAIIWILSIAGRQMHWSFALIFVGAIGFSSHFAFLTMQGLETAFTSLLMLTTALLTLKIITRPAKKLIFFWFLTAFLSALSRPDTVPFTGGVFLGLLGILVSRKEWETIQQLCFLGIIFALIGAIYMAWRISYFGSVFPNTFYLKMGTGTGIIKSIGKNYVEDFLRKMLFPYLILTGFLFGRHFNKERLFRAIPILLGCVFFGFYLLTIIPTQGHLWRFIYPVFPVFLLAIIYCFADYQPKPCSIKGNTMYLLLLLLFIAWPLHLISHTFYHKENKTQHDRVLIGKSLAGIDGTMLVSESGALPYYSDWKAVDTLGLNSEQITHKGLSIKIIEELAPDLVVLLAGISDYGLYDPHQEKEFISITNEYLVNEDFVAVAAAYKSMGRYHYYFVRKDSELFNEIVNRLLNVEDVKYGNLEKLMTEKRIPIYGAAQ